MSQWKKGFITAYDSYPGLPAVLMDLVAERAGFTSCNSFVVISGHELLQWPVNTWDVSADWWTFSLERAGAGVTFPKDWYDAIVIIR